MRSNRQYLIAICWFILSLFSSTFNDVIAKYTSGNLHSSQVSFLRFLFSTLSLMPIIMFYGKQSIKTSYIFVHIIRGTLLFLGMSAWIHGLSFVQVSTATVVSFSIPIFTLVLSLFFLKEHITWQRWIATVTGFIGIVITISPHLQQFNVYAMIFILSSIGFAMLDVINKIFVTKETMISMLFYSSLATTMLGAPSAIYYWNTPTTIEWVLFIILGISANLILFFILKAFELADATAIAPYRYLELIISACIGYLVFGDIPHETTWYGAAIIIPSTLFIIYSENKRPQSSNISQEPAQAPN